jgi:hypothetical protein
MLLLVCALLAPLTAVTSATTAGTQQYRADNQVSSPAVNSNRTIENSPEQARAISQPITFIDLSAFWTEWIAFAFTIVAGPHRVVRGEC